MSYGWSEAQQCGGVVNAPCSKMGLDNNGYVLRVAVGRGEGGGLDA